MCVLGALYSDQTRLVSVLLSQQLCNQRALSLLVVCLILSFQLSWRKTKKQLVSFSGGGATASPGVLL